MWELSALSPESLNQNREHLSMLPALSSLTGDGHYRMTAPHLTGMKVSTPSDINMQLNFCPFRRKRIG